MLDLKPSSALVNHLEDGMEQVCAWSELVRAVDILEGNADIQRDPDRLEK